MKKRELEESLGLAWEILKKQEYVISNLVKQIEAVSKKEVVPAENPAMVGTLMKDKKRPEAVKCDTKEQYNFLAITFKGDLPLNKFDNRMYGDDHGKYDCISKQDRHLSFSFTTGSEISFCGYKIISFTDYKRRENLIERWHKYLIEEAEKNGFKEWTKIKYAVTSPTYMIVKPLRICGNNLVDATASIIYDIPTGQWATIIEEQVKTEMFTKEEMIEFVNFFISHCGSDYEEGFRHWLKHKRK